MEKLCAAHVLCWTDCVLHDMEISVCVFFRLRFFFILATMEKENMKRNYNSQLYARGLYETFIDRAAGKKRTPFNNQKNGMTKDIKKQFHHIYGTLLRIGTLNMLYIVIVYVFLLSFFLSCLWKEQIFFYLTRTHTHIYICTRYTKFFFCFFFFSK